MSRQVRVWLQFQCKITSKFCHRHFHFKKKGKQNVSVRKQTRNKRVLASKKTHGTLREKISLRRCELTYLTTEAILLDLATDTGSNHTGVLYCAATKKEMQENNIEIIQQRPIKKSRRSC